MHVNTLSALSSLYYLKKIKLQCHDIPYYSSSQLAGTSSLVASGFALEGVRDPDPAEKAGAEPLATDVTLDRVQGVELDPDGRLPDIGFPVPNTKLPDTLLGFGAGLALVLLHAPSGPPDLAAEAGLRRSPRLPRRDGGCALA